MANNLWQKRLSDYLKEITKYLRYIFNDHLVLVMVFMLGAIGLYYSQWIKTLTPSFPVNPIMIVILVLVLSLTQVNTLLKAADLVYLTVMETRMKLYFKKAIITSFFSQLPLIWIAFIVLLPMYTKVIPLTGAQVLVILIYLTFLKGWNMLMWWFIHKQPQRLKGNLSVWLVNAVTVTVVILAPVGWVMLLVVVVAAGVLALTMKVSSDCYIKWDVLIAKEEARLNRFYRFANMFTDVSHLKNTTKKRQWLNWCYQGIAFVQKNTYTYLWRRAFIRTDEFSGLFVRLTLIGLLITVFMSNTIMAVLVLLLFSYLTAFQMLPMIRLYELHPMRLLYPVPMKNYRSSFIHLLRSLMAIQTVLFIAVVFVTFSISSALWMSVILLLFYLFFNFIYAPSKIKKLTDTF